MNRREYKKIMKSVYQHKIDKSKIILRAYKDKKDFEKLIEINPLLNKKEQEHNISVELNIFKNEINKPKSETKLKELYQEVREAHQAKTYKLQQYNYQKYISHLDNKKISEITKQDILNITNEMKKQGKANNTIKQIINILNPVFKKAIEKEIIDKSPLDNIKIKIKRNIKIVTNSSAKWKEIKKEIEKTYKDDPYHKVIFLFALYGRRKQEILRLKWENIDFENNYYWIIENKVDTAQKFSLPNEIKTELLKIKKIDKYIFYNPETKTHIKDIRKQILKMKKILNDNEFTLHLCRNILVSALAEQGVEAIYLSAILGHKDINTINIYLSQNNLKASKIGNEAIEKLL